MGEKFLEKKSRNAEKTERGPFGLVRYCMLRGKPFWFSSLGQQVHFGAFLKFCRTFGRTILVTSGVSKKNTDYVYAMTLVDSFLKKSAD